MRSRKVVPKISQENEGTAKAHENAFENISVGNSLQSTQSSTYEYAKAVNRGGKIVMETVRAIIPINEEKETNDENNSFDAANIFSNIDIDESKVPTMDSKTLRFNIESEEKEYKEKLALKCKTALRWALFVGFFAATISALNNPYKKFILPLFLHALCFGANVIYHYCSKFNYRSYSRAVWAGTCIMSSQILLTTLTLEEKLVSRNWFLHLVVCAVSLRTENQTTLKIYWAYLTMLSCTILVSKSEIIALRQIPVFFLYFLSSAMLCFETEKSDRMRYIYNKRIGLMEQQLELEKQRTLQIVQHIYPRHIASDLAHETIGTLKSYFSECVFIMAVRIVRHNEADSAPDFSVLQKFHRIVDVSFQSHSIDKIKYSGDTIIGCCGMFEVVQATQAATMFDAASDILKCMEAKSSKSKLQVCIGLSFGPAVCLIVDCQKSSVDIFGSCVDKALAMSNMCSINQSFVISDGLFVSNLDPARKSKLQSINPGHYFYIDSANDFSEIDETGLSLNNTIAEKLEIVDKEAKQSNWWNLSHEKSERIFVVGVDSRNHETMTGIVEDIDESELETFSFEDESNKRKTSILQVSLTLAIYLIYGFTDFVIFSQEEVLQWEDGGHLVFLRMAVILAIIALAIAGAALIPRSSQKKLGYEYPELKPPLLLLIFSIFAQYSRWCVTSGKAFMKLSSLQLSQNAEIFYYLERMVAYLFSPDFHLKAWTLFDMTYHAAFVAHISEIRGSSKDLLVYISAVLPIWILFWKLSSIKAAITCSEEKSRINQIKKAHEIQSQTEHAQLCLDTVMPRIFQTTIKQNKAFAQTPLPFACVAVVRISNIHQITDSMKIDAFKDLISEIFAEIEYVALLCGGEPVKTFGCSYTVCQTFREIITCHQPTFSHSRTLR